jgi:hypothetical protein
VVRSQGHLAFCSRCDNRFWCVEEKKCVPRDVPVECGSFAEAQA